MEYDRCEYQVDVSIKQFISSNGTPQCCWPLAHFSNNPFCYSCTTIIVAVLSKSPNQVTGTYLTDANVSLTLTTNVPALTNGSFPGIKLEFQSNTWRHNEHCVLRTAKDRMPRAVISRYERLYTGDQWCYAELILIHTLHCRSTSKQEQTTMTMTSPTSGLATKEKDDSDAASKMWIWCIILAIAYFIAGITIAVEVVYCCKMYRRNKGFPWCKVRRAKATSVDHGQTKSVTISLEKKPAPPPSKDPATKPASKRIWIKLDSQKEE